MTQTFNPPTSQPVCPHPAQPAAQADCPAGNSALHCYNFSFFLCCSCCSQAFFLVHKKPFLSKKLPCVMMTQTFHPPTSQHAYCTQPSLLSKTIAWTAMHCYNFSFFWCCSCVLRSLFWSRFFLMYSLSGGVFQTLVYFSPKLKVCYLRGVVSIQYTT